MEHFINQLSELNPVWIYVTVTAIAYIENVFPPFPSDMVVVAAGYFVGLGSANFFLALMLTTIGSTLGFMTMYKIGDWFGDRILETGKIKFIPTQGVTKVELWFQKYGYWIIVSNRFLAGTRAVVSFFAGLSELSYPKTIVLSFLSALVWNAILLYAGKILGSNWRDIAFYLESYSKVITTILVLIVLVIIARYLYKKNRASKNSSSSANS